MHIFAISSLRRHGKKLSNIENTFCGIDLLYKHTVSKCIYPSYFFIVLYLATYTAFFSHIHGGSSACWGERTWEKWRKFSRSKSFYVNCEDSDSSSPLKLQNSFKGQLHRNSSCTSQHLDFVIKYVISQPLIVNFVATFWGERTWEKGWNFFSVRKTEFLHPDSPLRSQNSFKVSLVAFYWQNLEKTCQLLVEFGTKFAIVVPPGGGLWN